MMRPALLIVVLWAALAASAQNAGPTLRHNPFAGPPAAAPVEGYAAVPAAAAEVSRSPELRATLVAGKRSIANLEGTILGIGEEAHGYRLLEVRDWDAVFMKDGARVVLEIDPKESAE